MIGLWTNSSLAELCGLAERTQVCGEYGGDCFAAVQSAGKERLTRIGFLSEKCSATRPLCLASCGAASIRSVYATSFGGVGMGRGVPLAVSTTDFGGVGMGRGVPLRSAEAIAVKRLLDKCLPDVLTGSRIRTADARTVKLTKRVFFMDEPLLAQP